MNPRVKTVKATQNYLLEIATPPPHRPPASVRNDKTRGVRLSLWEIRK